uniref:Uncharacterized protein n=1 Tax=Onchocerca volvulus TaxID=6282 RepID=A0A8R1XW76_ONCVO
MAPNEELRSQDDVKSNQSPFGYFALHVIAEFYFPVSPQHLTSDMRRYMFRARMEMLDAIFRTTPELKRSKVVQTSDHYDDDYQSDNYYGAASLLDPTVTVINPSESRKSTFPVSYICLFCFYYYNEPLLFELN